MRRRELLALLGSAPIGVAAAQGSNLPIVAVLTPVPREFATSQVDAIREGLAEVGLAERVHYVIEWRAADGPSSSQLRRQWDLLPALARELHAQRPAVFITAGAVGPVLELQPRPPIVFAALAIDPVKLGWAESYARPGGMVTGNVNHAVSGYGTMTEKRIGLFKELVPGLSRLGMFGPSAYPGHLVFDEELPAGVRASRRLGFQILEYRLRTIDDLESSVAGALRSDIDGIYLSGAYPFYAAQIGPAIKAAGKPTVGAYSQMTRIGVLMTYGANVLDGYRRAGSYAGKIIRGAKPGDLPIEQASKFTLAINAKTAQQLGIGIPPSLLASADEVIE